MEMNYMKKYIISTICIMMAVFMLSSCGKNEPEKQKEYLAVQFSEGGMWSIIDQDGTIVAENAYPADAEIFPISSHGIYWVRSNGWYKLYSVEHPDKPITDEGFREVSNFGESDRTAVYNRNEPIRIINNKGETIATLPESIDEVNSFNKDGYAIYKNQDDRYGVINSDGVVVVEALYCNPSPVSEGVFTACREWGDASETIFDVQGNKLGEIPHDRYEIFSPDVREGKIIAIDSNSDIKQLYVFNTKGEQLFTIPDTYEFYKGRVCYKDGYLAVTNSDGTFGVVDAQGKVVLQTPYTALINQGNGEFVAQKGEKWGVINIKGDIIVDFNYDADPFERLRLGDNFVMKKGDNHVLVSKEGKEVLDFYQFSERYNIAAYVSTGAIYEDERDNGLDSPEDDMEGYGTYGLMSLIPEGTSTYTGTMAGEYIIELTIVNQPSKGVLTATYRNVKYGTTIEMIGESLPADDGAISFFGEENGRHWSFYLTGDPEDIRGTATNSENFETNIALRRKH